MLIYFGSKFFFCKLKCATLQEFEELIVITKYEIIIELSL